MRVPLSWLAEYVALPEAVTPEEVHQALVSVGLEEEAIHRFGVEGPIVVGEVLEFVDEPQDNGKTIRWCQVKVAEKDAEGAPAVRGIVCGANNFVVGDKVVVTLPGAVLPGPFPISARKTYGHISDGMIASAKELGLGEDHAGILRLAQWGLDPAVGTDAIELLGLGDVAVEVNVTPDRGYALSIRGIAREYHHATGADYVDPVSKVSPVAASGFEVRIDDAAPVRGVAGCSVFIARSVMGIDPTAPTPVEIVSRLTLSGIRSISLPVDITNYVMLEFGQPIHGYDLDRLTGTITVRRATPGEVLTTLDGQRRTLDAEDLLITDESGPIGLAGVMGGETTEMDSSTTNVLIEAACFDPVSIARTQRRHKLPSEASKRFQRGVDPLVAEAAAQRVVDLLVRYAGGTPGSLGAYVMSADAGVMAAISFDPRFVQSYTGIEVSDDEVFRVLEDIGAVVDRTHHSWSVTPPSWRPDLTDQPTLVEEVARIVGFDSIPSVLPQAPSGNGLTSFQAAKRRISQGLAHYGLTEVLCYPFVDGGTNEVFSGVPVSSQIAVANALDPMKARLRASLIPGLVETAARNLSRGLIDLAVFETGQVFLPGSTLGTDDILPGAARPSDAAIEALNESLPRQPWRVAGLFLGARVERGIGQRAVSAGIADAVDAARKALALAGANCIVRQAKREGFHPGRCASIEVLGEEVGVVGEILPQLALKHDLSRVVAVFEIDIWRVLELVGFEPTRISPLSGYPAATQDISVVVHRDIPAEDVRAALSEGAGELLEEIRLVDEFRGESLPEGTRSLTFALRFRAADRTLTQAEATEAKEAGLALAASRHGATLRG